MLTDAKPRLPFLPPLTPDELRMLRARPYERPGTVSGSRDAKIASRLVERELLERDPTAPRVLRCTAKGMAAAEPLSCAAAERILEQVVDLSFEDPEAAASVERELHHRVLIEVAASDSLSWVDRGRLSTLAAIVVRTSLYDFRR